MKSLKQASLAGSLAILVSIGCVLSACSNPHVSRISDQKFAPTPAGQDVKLFATDVQQPYIMIAQVASFEARAKTPEVRREQLQDLQNRARKLGADAVINVTQLENEIMGFTRDEQTPFPSPEQGEWQESFLRGTAIKYATKEEASAAKKQALQDGKIPGKGRKEYDPIESAHRSRDKGLLGLSNN